MAEPDPFAALTSTEALEAWRAHERAARAAGRPFIVAGLLAAIADIGLFVYALFSNGFQAAAPVVVTLSALAVVGWGAGQWRIARHRRDHPFDPGVE
jgi:hypothetical protein